MLISFQDAVTASNLDPNQTHAVYYADGIFANRNAVAARCRHAKLYGITVHGLTGHGIFACDSETGDMTVDQAVAWVEEQIRLGVRLITVYANLSRWLSEGLLTRIQALEEKHGVKVRKWVADFNGVQEVPSWADAEQYATGSVDRNVALANFFGDAQPTPRPVHEWSAEIQVSIPDGSTGVLRFAGQLDLDGGHWDVGGTPGHVTFTGPGGGRWRVRGMPLDAKPLG